MIYIREKFKSIDSHYFNVIVVLFLLFVVIMLPTMAIWLKQLTGNFDTPDTIITFTINDYYVMKQNFGLLGSKIYVLQRFTFDLLWPIIYVCFIWVLNGRFTKYFKINDVIFFIPVIAFVLDLLENIIASIFFLQGVHEVFLYVLMVATTLKWVLLFIVTVVLSVELIMIVNKKRSTQNKTTI